MTSSLGQKFPLHGRQCSYCGFKAVTWDHVVPKAKGGGNRRANLTPSCKACNGVKADLDSGAFRAWLKTPAGMTWRQPAPELRSVRRGQQAFAEYDGRVWVEPKAKRRAWSKTKPEPVEVEPPELDEPERFKVSKKPRVWETHGWTPEALAALAQERERGESSPALGPDGDGGELVLEIGLVESVAPLVVEGAEDRPEVLLVASCEHDEVLGRGSVLEHPADQGVPDLRGPQTDG